MPVVEPAVFSIPITPVDGMFGDIPSDKIPPGGSPEMINCYVRGATLRKRPGYAKLGDTLHASKRVMGIYDAIDKDGNRFLFAATEVGLARYALSSDSWTAYSGTALTGSNEKLFSWEVSQDSVLFSQGVDQVYRTPFTGTSYAILNASCPPARFIVRFADRLYIASTVESGNSEPFRVRRSVAGDHTDWSGTGSGFTDLDEYPLHLRGLSKHGSQLLIAMEAAMWFGTRTGQAGAPTRFDPVVSGEGVFAPYTLTKRINDHLMMGSSNFLMFNGSRMVEIGQQIRNSVFFDLNTSKTHMNFAIAVPSTQEWVVFTCMGSESTPQTAWVLNWDKDIWYKWTFSGPVCGVLYHQQATRTWNNLSGTWAAQTFAWESGQGLTDFGIMATGHSDGMVYVWKDETYGDSGSSIACRWTSKDFTSEILAGPELKYRKLMLKTLGITYEDPGSSATLNFYLSTDGGATWGSAISVTLTGGTSGVVKTVLMTEKITGDRIRWKFEHASSTETFRIRQFLPEFEILGLSVAA